MLRSGRPMAAAAASQPVTALSKDDGSGDEHEEICRICRLPTEAGRPLRHPCACRGSIRFVHDDCQLRWLAIRQQARCELCNCDISTRPLYVAGAPVRLPIYEFMMGFFGKLKGLLLHLLFVILEFVIHLSTFGTFCLVLARSFVQMNYWLSLCDSIASVLALVLTSTPIFIRRGPGIFLGWVVDFIPVANVCLNLLNAKILHPLFLAWSLDIYSSKMFGTKMSESFKRLFASSFALTALYWFIGCIFDNLRLRMFRFVYKILKPDGSIPLVRYNVREPFYIFYFKKLHSLFVGIISMAVVILFAIQIVSGLTPDLFPLDIRYFSCHANDTSFWQSSRNFVDSVSCAFLLRFLVDNTNTLIYLEWLLKNVVQYSFVTTGHVVNLSASMSFWPNRAFGREIADIIAPKEYGRISEAKGGRRALAVHTILSVVLAWLTLVIFSSAVLILPISVGRAFLFAITRLPLAGGLKSNDLLALAVGFGIIATIIATSRDLFAYMTSGRTHLLALNRSLIVFLWLVMVPFLIGLLVDLLIISPFTAPVDDEVPVLDLLYYWTMGCVFLKIWGKLVQRTRFTPFLAYFIDERWDLKLMRAKEDWISGLRPMWWFFQDVFMPMATKLLTALAVPYLLAKGVFPRFGYSVTVNSAVYRFAWLGGIGFYALCYLVKVICLKLHDSIRNERYTIGQRLEDVPDSS